MKICRFLLLLFLVGYAVMLSAGDIETIINPDPKTLSVGDTATLTISLSGSISIPKLPAVDGIRWGGQSVSEQMSSINGKVSRSRTVTFGFELLKEGTVTIPAFPVGPNMTKPVTLNVGKAPDYSDDDAAAAQLAFLRLDTGSAGRTSCYEGEDIPLILTIFVRSPYALGGMSGLSLTSEPENRGDVLQEVQQLSSVNRKFGKAWFTGSRYQVVFRPTVVGQIRLHAAIRAQVVENDFFIPRMIQAKTLSAVTDEITVKPLPPPPDNAVWTKLLGGKWTGNFSVSPAPYRAGEPLTIQFALSGSGNVSAFHYPGQTLEHFRVYPPEVEKNVKRGNVSLRLTLIPLDSGEIPVKLAFSAFNTENGEYQVFQLDQTLKIEKAAVTSASVPVIDHSEKSAETEPDKPSPAQGVLYLHPLKSSVSLQIPLWKNALPVSIAMMVLGALVWLFCFLRLLRNRAILQNPDLKRRADARSRKRAVIRQLMAEFSEDGPGGDAVSVLSNYLNDVQGLPPGTSLSGIADSYAKNAPDFAEKLNAIAANSWAPKGSGRKFDAAFRAEFFKMLSKLTAIALLLIPVATMLSAAVADDSEQKAMLAYDSGNFSGALNEYKSLLKGGTASAALYYDIGNCLWQMGDLPRALVAFELATKLAPRDSDIRENLNLTRRKLGLPEKYLMDSPGRVPARIRELLRADEWIVAGAAGLMLCLSGIGLSLLYGRRVRIVLCIAGAALIVLAAAAIVTDPDLSGKDTDALTVTGDAPLYSLPSETSGHVLSRMPAGREVQIGERRMDWVRVRIGNEEGWMRAADVMPFQ